MGLGRQLASLLLLASVIDVGRGALTDTGCGTTKTCYKDPADCSPTSADCRFISWRKSDTGDTWEFEMSGSPGNGADYIAMALGTKNQMEDADLYYCDGNALHSGVISTHRAEPQYLTLEGGLVQKSAATESGVAECVLTRPRSVTKTITTGANDFDIVANEYYLLLAVGKTKAGGLMKHTWRTVGPQFNFSRSIAATEATSAPAATGATSAPAATGVTSAPAATGVTSAPAATVAASTAASGTQPAGTTPALSREGCGSKKTCFSNPENCQLTDAGCRFISWRKSDTGETYEFEMSGSAGAGGAYIAAALGTINKMQDADLYYCDGTTIHSAVITTLHTEPTYLTLQNGLAVKSATTVDGVAQCVLTRPKSVTKNITTGPYAFDIEANEYWLLAAQGLTKTDGSGEILPHTWKMVGEKYNFSAGSRIFALQPAIIAFIAMVAMTLSDSFNSA